jgi:hypothetical protein
LQLPKLRDLQHAQQEKYSFFHPIDAFAAVQKPSQGIAKTRWHSEIGWRSWKCGDRRPLASSLIGALGLEVHWDGRLAAGQTTPPYSQIFHYHCVRDIRCPETVERYLTTLLNHTCQLVTVPSKEKKSQRIISRYRTPSLKSLRLVSPQWYIAFNPSSSQNLPS